MRMGWVLQVSYQEDDYEGRWEPLGVSVVVWIALCAPQLSEGLFALAGQSSAVVYHLTQNNDVHDSICVLCKTSLLTQVRTTTQARLICLCTLT